jgi:hypothetical protein
VSRLVGLLAIGASGLVLGAGQPQSAADRPAQDSLVVPWQPGERLEYGVKFGIFSVGRGSLEVLGLDSIRGELVWHVRFTVHGGALGYHYDDSLESWFGAADLSTRRFTQQANEDGRPRSRRYEIFPDRRYWVRNDSDTSDTVEDPLDDASFFFFARTLEFEMGRTYAIPRYFIRDRNPVLIQVLARQTISVPAGRFRTIVVRPVFRSRGLFGQGGQALIWLSDDGNRIPVRIRGSLRVGTLEMSLRRRS